jgi:hypothetical protein
MRHKILGMTDGEIAETDKQIAYERNVGIIPAPPEEAPPEEGMGDEAPPEEGMEAGMSPEEGGLPEDDLDLSGDPNTDISALLKGLK